MTTIKLQAVTDNQGGLHINLVQTGLPANTAVDVMIRPQPEQPMDCDNVYGLKAADITQFIGKVSFQGADPLSYQRQIRGEWDRR